MKIDEWVKFQGVGGNPEKTTGAQSCGRVQFGQILEGEMSREPESSTSANVVSGTTACTACENLSARFAEDKTGTGSAAQSLTAALENLEAMEKALKDSRVGLKSLDGMFKDLSVAMEEMEKDLTGLPAEHPMRMIADEMMVLSYVESLKWRRGDYLA
ncbi:MAG: hypothetical protein GX443_12540 [Deltaproteobacteria bacterium]|nr:hypothetical protein [Deltaproteobacteria bacterium]